MHVPLAEYLDAAALHAKVAVHSQATVADAGLGGHVRVQKATMALVLLVLLVLLPLLLLMQ